MTTTTTKASAPEIQFSSSSGASLADQLGEQFPAGSLIKSDGSILIAAVDTDVKKLAAANLTVGTFMKVVSSGADKTLVDSSISETIDGVAINKELVAKSIKTKERSIQIGAGMKVRNSGNELEIFDSSLNETSTTAHANYTDSTGANLASDNFLEFRRVWDRDARLIQSDFSEASNGVAFNYGANNVAGKVRMQITTTHIAFPALAQRFYVRANVDAVGVRWRVYKGTSETDPKIYENIDQFDFADKLGSHFRIYGQSLTGTIAIGNGSNTLTGTGTSFLADLKPLDTVKLTDGRQFVIKSVASNTSATLEDAPYYPLPATTESSLAYSRGDTVCELPGGFFFLPNTTYLGVFDNVDNNVSLWGKRDANGQTGQFFFYFARVWQDIENLPVFNAAKTQLRNSPQIYAGSANGTLGSPIITAVNGTGAAFLTDFTVGDSLDFNGQIMTVASIQSNTQLTTNENAARTTSNIGVFRSGSLLDMQDYSSRSFIRTNQQRQSFVFDPKISAEYELHASGTSEFVLADAAEAHTLHARFGDTIMAQSGEAILFEAITI